MRIRIRHLSRTVQSATHAFAATVENIAVDNLAILDSVPVGAPQIAGTSENLLLWLQKQVYHRHRESKP